MNIGEDKMKREGCSKGFYYDPNLERCVVDTNYYPEWINYQKVIDFIEEKIPEVQIVFDENGLKGSLKNKECNLDIIGNDEVMQPSGQGWDVDFSQDPECKRDNILDFLACLYHPNRQKWQQMFAEMYHHSPHMFTAEEKYNMQDMVKVK